LPNPQTSQPYKRKGLILLAESAEDLQVQLNAFGEYCDNWKMKVNVNKTKIMVFGFGF
jgi:hypothetical protein